MQVNLHKLNTDSFCKPDRVHLQLSSILHPLSFLPSPTPILRLSLLQRMLPLLIQKRKILNRTSLLKCCHTGKYSPFSVFAKDNRANMR